MDEYSVLRWKVNSIEFCNIQCDANRKFVRIAVEVFEVEFHFINGTPAIDFVLQLNFVPIEIEFDSRSRLSKLANSVEFLAKQNFVDRALDREIKISRKPRVREICFAKAISALQY